MRIHTTRTTLIHTHIHTPCQRRMASSPRQVRTRFTFKTFIYEDITFANTFCVWVSDTGVTAKIQNFGWKGQVISCSGERGCGVSGRLVLAWFMWNSLAEALVRSETAWARSGSGYILAILKTAANEQNIVSRNLATKAKDIRWHCCGDRA